MRNTRPRIFGQQESDNVTMQQIMETMKALQSMNEEAKVDQLRPFLERGMWQTLSCISPKIFLLNAFFFEQWVINLFLEDDAFSFVDLFELAHDKPTYLGISTSIGTLWD